MIPAKQVELHRTSWRKIPSRAARERSCGFMHAAIVSLALPVLIAAQPPEDVPAAGDTSCKVLTSREIKIPMTDGVNLVGDVFRPNTSEPKDPVVLARTSYGRNIEGELYGEFFAKHGYAFVPQDVRGRFESEGVWTPFLHERNDGVDTIDWLKRQPWCNGEVAMFGASYGAMCAWQVASAGHSQLRAVIAMVNVADPDQFMPFDGGACHIGFAGWVRLLEAIEQPEGIASVALFDWDGASRTRPLSELDTFFGTSQGYVDEMLARPLSDRKYWRRLSYQRELENARVAGLHITGWFDVHRKGTFSAYERLRNNAATSEARNSQYLVVGPWAHLGVNRTSTMGSVDFGDQSLIDLNEMMVRFLNRHIKGEQDLLPADKRVRVFVTGLNRWTHASDWPLPGGQSQGLFLMSTGSASKRRGGGLLRQEADRSSSNEFDEFFYDPDNPPNFLGSLALYPIPVHVSDKSTSLDRADVLDYTSEAFAVRTEAIGAPHVVLYVSTDATDTDFAVELFRLTEDGKCIT